MFFCDKKEQQWVKKDVVSKEILKNIARDISKHILHIDVKNDMKLIRNESTRVESRESDFNL